MGKKKSKVNVEGGDEQKQQQKQSNNEDNGDANKSKSINVVLKVDLHCEGCASKIVKSIRGFEGVETVKCDGDANKLTVTGAVDPVKLREKVEQKTHKKVELISPAPKKENKENSNGDDKAKDNNEKNNDKQEKNNKKKADSKEEKKPNEDKKKSKEIPVTTAVMKVDFHCDGCIQKIHKIVSKTEGYREMKIDRQKELLTVTGAMEMKALADRLKKHLKKSVELLPPKKEGDKKGKEKGGDGDDGGKGKEGGAKEKKENGGGGGGGGMEGNKMQIQYGYPYAGPWQGYVPGPDHFQTQYYPPVYAHAPQMFSDENPNACSIM